jgi:pimeloyl-ACP methyl ester carboxylesterase
MQTGPEVTETPLSIAAIDGTSLAGTFVEPRNPGPIAVVITHGVASSHAGGVARWLGQELARHGIASVALDRRDAGTAGGSWTFDDGVDDLAVAIDVCDKLGYSQVVLAGHSKGTTYVPYYAATRHDMRVKAIALFAPVHDQRAVARESLMVDQYRENLRAALEAADRGDPTPIPIATAAGPPLEMSPAAFISMFGPESDAVPRRWVTEIDVPTFVCRARTDSLTPDSYQDAIVNAGHAARVPIVSIVVEDPLDDRDPADAHRFGGLESVTAKAFAGWIRDLDGAMPRSTTEGVG